MQAKDELIPPHGGYPGKKDAMKQIYLDYAATTPADPEVVRAMLPYFDAIYANASSEHSAGLRAREAVEAARSAIASFMGALPEEIIFTSGGTEGNNHAVRGLASFLKAKGKHIITTQIEHPSIAMPCRLLEKDGFSITYLPVDRFGLVDPGEVKRSITNQTILISVMHANNEIGTIEPIEDIAKIAQEHGICLHTDAVQTVGHLPINIDSLGANMLSASAHKFYGPKGAGFLYAKKGTKLVPFMQGGGQENGRRASTYNVPGIVGMAKAIELAGARMAEEDERLIALRDKLIKGILDSVIDSFLNGHPEKRLPNNVSVLIKNIPQGKLLNALDAEGIYCTAGAACKASIKVAAAQDGDKSGEALRLSLGKYTTAADIDYTIDVLASLVKKLRG
jgi:cysteine desulfurase